MTGAIAVEPVALALAHGLWFLPGVEIVGRAFAPAERCAVREAGWLAYAAVLVASPLQPAITGWGGYVPWIALLLGGLPGAWALLRWAASVRLLRMTATSRWGEHRGVPVELGDVPGPLTWGLFAPRIVLPRAAARWPEARLDAILAHERAHVARADYLRRLIGLVVGVILGAHPAFVWSRRRHAVDVELAADARALAAGLDRRAYAQALLDLGAARPAPGAALAGHSCLGRRIRAVLQRPRARPLLGVIGLVGLGLALARGLEPAPAPPVPPPPPPACRT